MNRATWVANARIRELMDGGCVPPETGSKKHKESWGTIEAQIECELFGVIYPGMEGEAYEMAKWFVRVTSGDYAVEAAVFYTVMSSYAFFESDVPSTVEIHLTKTPTSSLTYQIVSDVVRWHRKSLDWRVCRWNTITGSEWMERPLAFVQIKLHGMAPCFASKMANDFLG